MLRSLSEGFTAEQTAARFNVSVNTIRTQIRTLYRKLGVSSRREAIAIAQEAGILAAARGEAVGRSERRYAPGRRAATGTATSITGPGPPASQVGR
ncbi:ATP-dependent transcriptional activator malT [Mycobacteroides abscessus]|nr:ATP-dependent transcriptional activator malT [Mycobacteroides abscessus]